MPCPESVVRYPFVRYTWPRGQGVSRTRPGGAVIPRIRPPARLECRHSGAKSGKRAPHSRAPYARSN